MENTLTLEERKAAHLKAVVKELGYYTEEELEEALRERRS